MKKPSEGLIDILSSPWAIMPDKLQEIELIYKRHLHGEKADAAAIEAAIGKKDDTARKVYEVHDGVAVLPVVGVIAKRMNLFTAISGGVSTQLLQRDLQQAIDDKSVHSIILSIDTPGGTIDGTQAVANTIRDARTKKTIVTVADGLMASAGYWIGSAASRVFIADETTMVGSIGVVATHEDWSRYEDKLGVKTTEITAGRYKRIASEFAPLSPEGRADIQERIDQLYTIFVNDVAANRGVDVETVLSDMADGRIFVGRQSVSSGLVDGVKTLEEVIYELNDSTAAAKYAKASRVMVPNKQEKGKVMDVKTLKKEHPDLVEAITNEATAGMDAKVAGAKTEGAEAERDRVMGLGMVFFGEELGKKFEAVAASGITVDQYKAVAGDQPNAVASSEAASIQKKKDELLSVIEKSGAENPGAGDGTSTGGHGSKDFLALVDDYEAQHGCGKVAAMKAVMKANPEAHKAYIASMN